MHPIRILTDLSTMQKNTYYTILAWMLVGFLFQTTSCQKFAAEEDSQGTATPTTDDTNVYLHISEEKLSLFSRVSFGIFHGDKKVQVVHQRQGDNSFGTLRVALEAGEYQVVALGYQNEKPCTLSHPDKVTFPNNQVTPTYLSYQPLTVEGNTPTTLSLAPKTIIGEFCVNITDDIPADAKTIQFYYTGGSSTLDATTGYGCVNSRQTVELPIHSSQHQYSVYTIPHADGRKLKVVITVYDSSGKTMAERTLGMVEVSQGQKSTCSLALFGSSNDDSTDINITFVSDWKGEKDQDIDM